MLAIKYDVLQACHLKNARKKAVVQKNEKPVLWRYENVHSYYLPNMSIVCGKKLQLQLLAPNHIFTFLFKIGQELTEADGEAEIENYFSYTFSAEYEIPLVAFLQDNDIKCSTKERPKQDSV